MIPRLYQIKNCKIAPNIAVTIKITTDKNRGGLLVKTKINKKQTGKVKQKYITKQAIESTPLEKSLVAPTYERNEAVEMITHTKYLFQNIQKDVETYMQKLQQIENQFIEPVSKVAEMPKEQPTEIKGIDGIEAKVDKLLSDLDKKKND